MNMSTQIENEFKKIQPQILEQIIEMLDTAIDANIELINLYRNSGKKSIIEQLLDDLCNMMDSLTDNANILHSEKKYSMVAELLENVQDTLDTIKKLVDINNKEKALEKMEFQLLPFIRNLRESFYFWGMIYPDKDRMDLYYKEEFANNYRNLYVQEDVKMPYKISIIILAYNHLDVTKKCVEQVLKETDFEKLNAELILIDHGSTDGTLEYFESLNIGKIIHFKKNVRMYMLITMFLICRSEYYLFVSNDILVTNNWVEILTNCMDSDDKIIQAVPVTPNVANLQSINIPMHEPREFIEWAKKTNKIDFLKWDDRARLMPPVGIFRIKEINNMGYADPLFYTMEFSDDDFSLRARRAGYRQVLCGDVACYHFGSVTNKEFQHKESTLEFGRELFIKKHGVDPWGNGFCYDYNTVSIIKDIILNSENEKKLLGIDCGFGDTLLQVKNEMRHLDKKCITYHINGQEKYNDDVKCFSDEYVSTNLLSDSILKSFNDVLFDVCWIERDLEEYEDIDSLFNCISRRLENNGCLVCHCSNSYHVYRINSILNFGLGEKRISLIDFNYVVNLAKKYFKNIEVIAFRKDVEGIQNFVNEHYSSVQQKEKIIDKISVDKYYFSFKK